MELRALARDRAFLLGLAVRLVLVAIATPAEHMLVTMPALTELSRGVFPAGFTFGLPTLLASYVGYGIGSSLGVASVGLGLTVLAADLGVFLLLGRTGSHERRGEVAHLYWQSPLVIWLLYGVGSLAALSALLLVATFIAVERRRYAPAGVALGLAAACQPALLLVLGPIGLVFAFSLTRLRAGAGRMIVAAGLVTLTLVVLPAIMSAGFRQGVLVSPEMRGLIMLQLPFGPDNGLAILPLLVVGISYLAWRARVIDYEMLWAFASLVLLTAIGAGDSSPAMMLLAAVFLTSHAAYAERSGRALLIGLSTLLLGYVLLFHTGPVIDGVWAGQPLAQLLPSMWLPWLLFFADTIIAGVVIVVWMQVFQRGVLRAATYLAARRPIAVGIAGDSGVGKDTLSDSIAALFSARTVATVSGDDYHNWDRNKPMWRALTHLNPKANDLALFNSHVTQLVDRRWVRARHYDHATGRMTKPLLIRPGEVVLASGLHALSSPAVNALYDLRIFLDMDEELRRFFKIRRDVNVRSHPLQRVVASLERRHGDALRFIHPQKGQADLIFRLEPRRREMLADYDSADVPMRLVVDAVPGIGFDRVVRTLVSICDIQAVELAQPSGASRLLVEGEPSLADIAAAARRLAPGMRELMDDRPGWEGGLRGVLQLVTLDQLEQIRVRRSVNA